MLKVHFGTGGPFNASEWRFSLSPQSHQESFTSHPWEGLLQLQDNLQFFSSILTPSWTFRPLCTCSCCFLVWYIHPACVIGKHLSDIKIHFQGHLLSRSSLTQSRNSMYPPFSLSVGESIRQKSWSSLEQRCFVSIALIRLQIISPDSSFIEWFFGRINW